LNILFSCIGRRGYVAEYFRVHLKANDRIIGTSNSQWTPGFTACDLGVLMPDIASEEYLPTLIKLCREQEVQALLSFYDPDIHVLSGHLNEFRDIGIVPVIPNARVADICFDKYRTYLFLKENGFNAPLTFLTIEQVTEALEEGKVSFPFVVKPRYGFGSQNIFQARKFEELEVFFHYASDMLIQDLLAGEEYDFDICLDLQGEVLSVVLWRKIARRAGETYQAEACVKPDLLDLGYRLGKALGDQGHVGPLDVDLFLQEDNKPFILELNPRFGGGYPVSHLAGADFPHLILRMIRGEAVSPELGRYKPGVIMMKAYNVLGGEAQYFFDSNLDMRYPRN
jgi:carbamoyl-phosphate synthase large subunit